ncbi:MAG: hypothetical protein AB7Q37_06880 [Pyrinomonadaceae bacterium]
MFLGPTEILLCLAPLMLVIFSIGVGLAAQNLAVARHERERGQRKCPYCKGLLNPEAYICRFCRKELYEYRRA